MIIANEIIDVDNHIHHSGIYRLNYSNALHYQIRCTYRNDGLKYQISAMQ